MVLHHRHKQRILTTIISLIVLFISIDVYLFLEPVIGMETALLYSFTVAIGLVVVYQCYNYRHSHEHLTLVNTLTQIFLGSVLFFSAVLMLVLQAIFGIDVLDSYLALSLIVIVLTFVFLKRFDAFLEREVSAKFPMGDAPSPKARIVSHDAKHDVKHDLKPARTNPVKNMNFKHRGR